MTALRIALASLATVGACVAIAGLIGSIAPVLGAAGLAATLMSAVPALLAIAESPL